MELRRITCNEWKAQSCFPQSLLLMLACRLCRESIWAAFQGQAPVTFQFFPSAAIHWFTPKEKKKEPEFYDPVTIPSGKSSSAVCPNKTHILKRKCRSGRFHCFHCNMRITEVEDEVIRNSNHRLDRQRMDQLEVSVPLGLHFFALSFLLHLTS